MRTAKIKDTWRDALRNKSHAFSLDRISLKNIKGIGNKELSFPTMITALCGENGVGKTTLLKTIFASLTPKNADKIGIRLRPQNSAHPYGSDCEISANLAKEGDKPAWEKFSAAERIQQYFKDGGDDSLVLYIDAAATSQRIIHSIGHDADFPSVLDGLDESDDPIIQREEPNESTKKRDLRELRREITGRNYSSVKTIEVEEYGNFSVFPYFRAVVGKIAYCSEEMGLGELCVNYLIWSLERCQDGSLVLLEEPESHLPPRAQERLMAYIAELSIAKRLTIIVSTHSQHTLENIANTHITFLGRFDDEFLITTKPSLSILYESLRISTTPLTLLIVEDHSAFAMTKGIIAKFDFSLLDRVDFTWKNGYSDIDAILSAVPRKEHSKITLVGIYDGDQEKQKRPENINWPFLFLPGDEDPIFYLVTSVRKDVRAYAKILAKNADELLLAVANLATTDIKDFFIKLRKSSGIDLQILYDAAADLWLASADNEILGKKFMKELKSELFKN